MKNVLKAFGVIALVAIIGFSMAGCKNDDDGGGGGGGGGNTINLSLNGTWESDHGIVISIYSGKAVFTNIDAFAGWQEVEKRGNIKIGVSYFRNINKTGDWTWSFQAQTYNLSTYELSSWAPGTITLNSNGQTFTANVPTAGGSHTFTRK